jgi:hypothetical protein
MLIRSVLNKPVAEMNSDEFKATIDVYKMLVDMADKVSARRQTANNFYLSVNTLLVGASSWAAMFGAGKDGAVLLSLAGLAVALVWGRNIATYKDLNAGKFHVITELEKELPLAPYGAEWDVLQRSEGDRSRGSKRYRPFHSVEILVPIIFASMHVAQIGRLVPWARWISITCAP